MTPHDDQKLERLVHQTLRSLPPRPAPRSLEARVLAELERRAALPWWRHNVARWPVPARAAGIVLLAAFAWLFLKLATWATAGFTLEHLRSEFAQPLAVYHAFARVGHTLFDAGVALLQSVPSLWLYGGLAIVGFLYLAFFGVGTVAYRTLYTSR